MSITIIKQNGLWAWLVKSTNGTVHLMPPPEFIMDGCIALCTGEISNWEWREILKHWQTRVTGSGPRS